MKFSITHPALVRGLVMAGLWALGASAHAVPSFARQTGMDCSGCHIGAFGPQLTPAGIKFKLGGYTDTDGKDGKVPLSAMVVGSLTRTKDDQNPPPDHLKSNNNLKMDEASIFLAGRVMDHVGGFVQVTHSGVDHGNAIDQVDLRYASTLRLGGKDTLVGVSVNNNPGVQDPFNTMPAWGYPFVNPEGGFGTGDAASLLNAGLEQRVIGASAYALFDDSYYAELGSYRSLASGAQDRLGLGRDEQKLGGNAYWRLAYFRDLKSQAYSLGLFGWKARLAPDRADPATKDHHNDIGVDGSYQFLGTREHIVTFNGSMIRERLREAATGESGTLREHRASVGYTYNQTWGASAGLFNTTGTGTDVGTRGALMQVDWTPWGKEDHTLPGAFSLLNLKVGAQYWAYNRFNGVSDGASGHNTTNLFLWTSF